MTLSIYRNGVVVESVTIDDTAKLSQSFMGGNYLNVPLTVTRKLDVLPLDYVFFEGERYTLYDEPESRVFDGMIDYTLIFHAPYFELYNKRYKNLGDLEFDYSGDLVDFLNVLIESMGEESGFTLGTVESIGWQTITFSNKSCYGALVDICKAFEAEFVVSGKEISAGKSLAADTAYTFEYGRGKGLYELKREEIGNSSVVTVLHVFGGTTNVPAGYHLGGKYGRLALPAPLTQNVDIYGVREDEVTFDEIYPRLKDKGLLAVTVPEDIASAAYWRVKLDIDFDLSKCVQPGLTAQLQFRSGELMGITFDLLAGSFDNTTKEVSIIVKEEGDARYPSLTRQPKVGDQFVLLNIDMDDSYLTAAQEELQQKGQEYLDKVSSTQWLYKLTIDPHEYGRRGYVISVGDKIRVKDSRLGFDAKIRVSERTVQLTDPRNIELTISDEVLYSSDERLNHEVSGNSEQVSIHSDDIRAQYLMLKYNEQVLKQIIAAVEPILDVIYYDPDLDAVVTRKDFLSQKGISAYGLGSTSGGSASGSLGELVNVGQWADAVPTADRVMVQLAGATHWSAQPLADLVGLDTAALAQYLTANSYLKASDISSYLTWANLSGKPTVYPTSWELVTGRPTKLSDLTDDVVAGNYLPKPTWDAVFEVVTVDGTPALKVKYDILGLKGITAYADGSLSGGFSGALVDLVDVAVTNLASGDILKYNGTHFVNVPVSSIAGASSWDQITGKPEYYPTRWADVSGAPASLPASDVYPWAKAASKPTYTAAEVGAVALNGGGDVSGSINASAYLTANTLRAKAALYPTISFVKTNDNSESLLIVAGNNLYYRPVASDTTNRLVYHSGNFNPGNYLLLSGGTMTGDITFGSNGRSLRGSDGGNIAGVLYDTPNARYVTAIGTGSRRLILVSPASIYRGAGGVAENYMIYDSGNFNPSSKLDKSVWDEAFELKTVNGVRVISAKLDFLSVAGISAYATGPSSGGGGGGLDYDLLKQALTGAITPDGYPFTISASFLGAIDKTYLTGKLANTYADKVHTHLWTDITDRPTALPANGGNADTVDNLHASSFARADQAPDVDLNTVNGQGIMACRANTTATAERHYPIQQAGTLFYGTAAYNSANQIYGSFNSNRWFVRGGGTSQTEKTAWAEIWTTVNFNPSSFAQIKSYTYPSGGVNNITDLDFTGNIQAHFPGAEYSCIWQGKDFAGTILQLKLRDYAGKQSMMYRGSLTKTWRTVWDSGNFNPANYLPLSGGSITGGLGVSGYLTAGVLRVKATSYPQISFVNTTTNRDSLLFVNGSELYWRPTAGTATDYQVYHSGNFNPDSKLGVSSVAVEAKKMSCQGLMTAISGTTTFPAGLYLYGVYNNGYPVTYGNLLRVGGSGLGEMLFGWAGDASVGGLYYRSKRDVAATAWSNWCKLWTSANSNLSTIDWSANNLNAAANLDVAGQAYVSGWLRSRGNVGWYSQDYGGGIHMTDSTWVRVYGSKGLMIDTGTSPINMGQLQITCSAEASIGFRSASNGNWCLGKGVSSIGSGFGLYNAATNRVAFQIASATDNASFVGSITAPTFVGNLSGSASSVNGYDINSFTGYYKYTIDASSLDQNTYYPVTMYLGKHNTVRISVLVALDSGTKPAWSSHASGYSVRFIEEVNGSGWGTSEVSRNILANEYRFANANPVGRVEQMTNSSTEVIWVRGGGKYFFYLSIPYITPALRTSTFTNASQSVSPRTDTMDLRMAANGNGIAVSKLYAHNSIEINGFTIDVYNGALRVNGNLVATGGVASLTTA